MRLGGESSATATAASSTRAMSAAPIAPSASATLTPLLLRVVVVVALMRVRLLVMVERLRVLPWWSPVTLASTSLDSRRQVVRRRRVIIAHPGVGTISWRPTLLSAAGRLGSSCQAGRRWIAGIAIGIRLEARIGWGTAARARTAAATIRTSTFVHE